MGLLAGSLGTIKAFSFFRPTRTSAMKALGIGCFCTFCVWDCLGCFCCSIFVVAIEGSGGLIRLWRCRLSSDNCLEGAVSVGAGESFAP